MTESYYGSVFRQIRLQKNLPLSFFEKIGIKKSCISKFERGDSKMSFEKIYEMLEAMDVSLKEYQLFINRFSPTYLEEFFATLDRADLYQDHEKLSNLYEKASSTSNFLLALIVKSKTNILSNGEIQRILTHLYEVKFWGYLEFSLLHTILLNNTELDDINNIFIMFENRIDQYRGNFRYVRKIYQIAYQFVLIFSIQNNKQFAEKIITRAKIAGHADFDFFISNIQKLVTGFMKYKFENADDGLQEINEALSLIKILGGEPLYNYYYKKIYFYINLVNKNK